MLGSSRLLTAGDHVPRDAIVLQGTHHALIRPRACGTGAVARLNLGGPLRRILGVGARCGLTILAAEVLLRWRVSCT